MKRPDFKSALAFFTTVRGDGSVKAVGDLIGGKVKQNIDAGTFTNACALRMSYVLNMSGDVISLQDGASVTGADGKRYMFRVRDLRQYLLKHFGKPDLTVNNPEAKDLAGMQGIVAFDIEGWSDASGHVTLWDGATCSDHCYFVDHSAPPLYKSKAISLWALK